MGKKIGVFFILLLISLIFEFRMLTVAEAQETGEVEATGAIKKVQGEVNSLTPRNNPKYIGITYKEEKGSAYEIVLFIDKDIKLVHKKELSEIRIGDTVGVTYEEVTTITEEGRMQTKRVAKEIRFLRPADKTTRHKYGIYTEEEKREMREKEVLKSMEKE